MKHKGTNIARVALTLSALAFGVKFAMDDGSSSALTASSTAGSSSVMLPVDPALAQRAARLAQAVPQTTSSMLLAASKSATGSVVPHAPQTAPAEAAPPVPENPRANAGPSTVLKRYLVDTSAPGQKAALQTLAKEQGGKLGVALDLVGMTSVWLPETVASTMATDHGLKPLEDALVSTAAKPNVKGKQSSIGLGNASNSATSTPSALIRVAVLDTGIGAHPDLSVTGSRDIVQRSDAHGVKDRFAAANYRGSDGITLWNESWVEYMDNNNPHSGTHSLVGSDLGYALQIKPQNNYSAIDRRLHIVDASAATVSFKWKAGESASGQSATTWLEVYSPQSGWQIVHTMDRSDASEWQSEVVDLTPYISNYTIISFSSADSSNYTTLIDDVAVNYAVQSDTPDGYGHGTHVAGIVGSKGLASSTGARGVSKGAKVVSVRVLDSHGRGYMSDVIEGLDWVLQNAASQRIRVVNLSLGKPITTKAIYDPLVQAVERLWDAGIVVVASSGNYGEYGNFTVTSPGNSPKIITVGSVEDNDNSLPGDDFVSEYSSRGPTMMDHYLKPDLVAPGTLYRGTANGDSKLSRLLSHQLSDCDWQSGCANGYLD
ncbi:MAG: S8 family serine peptidase, partial [Pseudomonadales bacterium]